MKTRVSKSRCECQYHVSYEYLKADMSINEDMSVSRQM